MTCYQKKTKKFEEFAQWILAIGEGKIGNMDEETNRVKLCNPMESIMDAVYAKINNISMESSYLTDRAILAPTTMEIVDQINECIMIKMS